MGEYLKRPSTPKMPSSSACSSNDSVFQFAQYKGQTFREVTKQSPSYFMWAIKQKSPGKFLKTCVDWVQEERDFDEKNRVR